VQLRLLGAPTLQAGAAALALPVKDALLLALLALDGPSPREALANLLWPDAPAASRRTNLRQRIKRLQDQSGRRLLRADGSTLALDSGVHHDLQRLAETLAADPQAATGALLGHLQVEGSQPASDWLAQARQRVDARRRQCLQARAQALEDAEQLDAALAVAQRLVSDDPMNEEAQRRLMQLHHRRGDRAAALAAYARLCSRLQAEMGAEPDTQTRDLAALIEATPPTPPAAGQRAATRAALLRPPQLLQRQAEWARLERLAAEGGIALVLGDAGMGKTRLLHDFADHAGWGLRLQARPGDAAVPYALLARWVAALQAQAMALPEWARAELARLLPTLGPHAPGEPVALRLTQALALLNHGQPAVLLDDLHFADGASLELLPAVLAPLPVALLAARRHGLPTPLQAWLQDAGAGVLQLPLQAWDIDTVALLLRQLALSAAMDGSWAQALWQHTGGHPLLVLETLREALLVHRDTTGLQHPPARLPAPQPLLQLLQQRLHALSPLALQLVQLAALAGEFFGPGLAARVLATTPPALAKAWQEVQEAAMMSPRGQWHDLVLEAARGTLAAPQAQVLHGAMAEQLSGQGCPPARLALHWAAAGQPARAAACHEAAAQQAGGLSRRLDEASQYDQAARCWAEAGDEPRAFAAAAEAADRRVRGGEVSAALAQAEQLLAQARSLPQQAQAQRLRAMAQSYAMQHEAALQAATAAQASAQAAGRPDWAAEMAGLRALAAAILGQHELARQCLAEEAALPAHPADWRHMLTRHSVATNAWLRLGHPEDALQRIDQSIALADRPEARSEHVVLLGNSATVLLMLGGRNAEALQRARAGLAGATALGEQAGMVGANLRMHVGMIAGGLGLYAEAVDALSLCLEDLRRLDLQRLMRTAENHLAGLWAQLGQPARALQLLQAGAGELSPTHRVRRWALHLDLQRLCGTRAPAGPAPEITGDVDPSVAALAQLALLRQLPAEQRITEAETQATRFAAARLRGHAMQARLLRLQALAELQRPEAGATGTALLHELNEGAPCTAYGPEARWLLYAALKQAGQHAAAAEALAQAAQWVLHTAATQLHPEHRDAFLRRNRINAAVLAAQQAAPPPG
jgi:DNA-binding SARP family transcriptional activator